MKVLVVLCLLFAILATSYGQVITELDDFEVSRNQVLANPGDINYYSFIAREARQNVSFIATPCLGSFSLFIATGYIPTTNRSLSGVLSTRNDTAAFFIGSNSLYVTQNRTTYAGIRATSNAYNNVAPTSPRNIVNNAAVFEIFATILTDNTTIQQRTPLLDVIKGLTNYGRDTSRNIGYLTYPVSSNPLDSYSYYRYNGTYNFETTGYISGSPCGVKLFMEPAYPVKTTNNNDNTRTVEFTVPFNDPGFQYHSFVVLVTRDCSSLGYQCLDAVFERVDISGSASMITFSWIAVLFFAAFLMLLF